MTGPVSAARGAGKLYPRTLRRLGRVILTKGRRYHATRTIFESEHLSKICTLVVLDMTTNSVADTLVFTGPMAREAAIMAVAEFNDAVQKNGGVW